MHELPHNGERTDDEGFEDLFGEAVDDFRATLSSTLASPDRERRIVELYEQYAAVLSKAMQSPEVSAAAAERYEDYARAVGEAYGAAESRAALADALKEYVTAIQSAWAAVDVDMLEAADLSSIAEEMQWVASIAQVVQSTAGNGR
jgi:hypothetical protein